MSPLATAPAAQADEFDWVADLIDPLMGIDPDDGGSTDALASFDPSSWFSGGDPSDTAEFVNQYLYEPLHSGIEDWINSPFGEQVDGLIN